MGGNNERSLEALKKYLKDKHLDKKKERYSTGQFESLIVKHIPQQMNRSDCGMFTC